MLKQAPLFAYSFCKETGGSRSLAPFAEFNCELQQSEIQKPELPPSTHICTDRMRISWNFYF